LRQIYRGLLKAQPQNLAGGSEELEEKLIWV